MTSPAHTPIDPLIHHRLAVDLFNHVWELIEKNTRNSAQEHEMIHAAHASVYHWSQVGTAVNLSRGEWQVSRVYAVLSRAEPARYHAARSLEICLENNIGDFDLAFAYEALARAAALAGNSEECRLYLQLAQKAARSISEDEDRDLLLSDLKTIPVAGLP